MDITRPLVTAGLFLTLAKLYTTSQDIRVPLMSQATVAAVLGGSALAVSLVHADSNAAVRSLTTGSVFAGAMYLGLGNQNVVIHAVLGTLSAYSTELILPVPETKQKEEVNEFD